MVATAGIGHKWTEPYFGVTHYVIDQLQATVEDYGVFAVATFFNLGAPMPFTNAKVKTFHREDGEDYIAKAKVFLETHMKRYTG